MKSKNHILQHLGFIVLAFASNSAHANTYTWNTNTNGALWSASGSWVGAAVPTFAAGDTFDLSTRNITVNSTTSSMDTVGGNTLGTIKIGDSNNTHTWILALSTALTLNGNGSAATINQVSTSKGDTINGAGGIILASNLNTTNDSGNVLSISTEITASGGTRTITNNGGGSGRVNLNSAIGSGINLVQNSTTSATWMLGASASFNGTITVKAGNFEVGATGANGIALGTAAFTLGDTSGSSDATLVFKSGNGSGYSAPITVASGSTGIKSIFGAVTSGNNTYALNGAITLGASSSATADVTIGNSTGSTSTYNVQGGITGFGNVTVKTLSSGKTRFATTSINNTGTLTNAGTGTGVAQIDVVIGSNVTGVVQNSSTSQMNLTQANTYTGATTITLGTLALGSAGSIDNTSGVSLGTVGTFDVTAKGIGGYTVKTLTGSGNVTGALTVSTQLAIGNSPGTVNFSSSLTLGSTSTYLYELTGGSNTADLGDLAGNLTITAGAILDLVQLGSYTANDKFTLFAYDGTLTGTFTGLADGATFTDAGGMWMIDYNDATAGLNGGVSASNTYVTVTAVPEPEAALLGGIGMLILLRRRRN